VRKHKRSCIPFITPSASEYYFTSCRSSYTAGGKYQYMLCVIVIRLQYVKYVTN